MSPDMSTYRIDLLPENDRTNGWAAHLPPRVPRPHLTGDARADSPKRWRGSGSRDAEQAAWGVAEDWGMTPANSFVGATMRYTPDRRLLIREKVRYRPGMRVTEAERRRAAERHKRLFDARFPMLRDSQCGMP